MIITSEQFPASLLSQKNMSLGRELSQGLSERMFEMSSFRSWLDVPQLSMQNPPVQTAAIKKCALKIKIHGNHPKCYYLCSVGIILTKLAFVIFILCMTDDCNY